MNLTVVASNYNRLDVNSDITKCFIKSIQWQTYDSFCLLIADGGSDNQKEIIDYFNKNTRIPMKVVSHKIEIFSRSLLNNVGVRNAETPYVLTTDVDMLMNKDFIKEVMENSAKNHLVESRTMYIKDWIAKKIYDGEIDPLNDWDSCKIGRIKKRTSAGGCQCMHIDSWNKLRGFDERYKVWGSEDYDLLTRSKMAGIKTYWIGENTEEIKLIHQPHPKKDLKRDLEWQDKNKKFLESISSYQANIGVGWGGKSV